MTAYVYSSEEELVNRTAKRKKRGLLKNATAPPIRGVWDDLSAKKLEWQIAERECRLTPGKPSKLEEQLFKSFLQTDEDRSAFVAVRNDIALLWSNNPKVAVEPLEVLRLLRYPNRKQLILLCYEYLVRQGCINYGIVRIPSSSVDGNLPPPNSVCKSIVVIGAGIAGLSCARQLQHLFTVFKARLSYPYEPPSIKIIEANTVPGGRIRSQVVNNGKIERVVGHARPDFGAQIVVGKEGNPMYTLGAYQLELDFHTLKDDSVLYDVDGSPLDGDTDSRAEELSNYLLDLAASFRPFLGSSDSAEMPATSFDDDKTPEEDYSLATPTLQDLMRIGYEPRKRPLPTATYSRMSKDATLGNTLDALLLKCLQQVRIPKADIRALHWHWANLEYANATYLTKLSLLHWDQDDGHGSEALLAKHCLILVEFDGDHCTVVGGYSRIPLALATNPDPLEIQYGSVVEKITNHKDPVKKPLTLQLQNGSTEQADMVVVTASLGALKHDLIEFDPPLPRWKRESIQKLGFGVLNKVILRFSAPFWDMTKNLIGCLQSPADGNADLKGYREVRGRFFIIWNCFRQTGKPILGDMLRYLILSFLFLTLVKVALVAGQAAADLEEQPDTIIVGALMATLNKIYTTKITKLERYHVTRWQSDPITRGSYSYVAAGSTGEDYDNIARPIYNKRLYFAGEATARTHPATVHGAYLSGLRAASDILDFFIGPFKP